MSGRDTLDVSLAEAGASPSAAASPLLQGLLPAAVIGELLGVADDGATLLVRYPGQPGSAALRARSVIDLNGSHIERSVILMFERGDGALPIVVGLIRQSDARTLQAAPAQVEIDADGARMVVSARDQLVLRCGEASITLTRAGKVLIQGSYVSSQSTGVNRIKGGSVQLN